MSRFIKSKKVSDTGNSRKLGPDTVPEDRDTVGPWKSSKVTDLLFFSLSLPFPSGDQLGQLGYSGHKICCDLLMLSDMEKSMAWSVYHEFNSDCKTESGIFFPILSVSNL